MNTYDLYALGGFVVAVFVVASSGAIFPPGAWYETLRKPSWTPPNWLFGPAWAVLYVMIAVAGWLVWLDHGFAGAGLAFTIFGVQLVLNAAWSGLFFGLKRPDIAFGEVILLWLSIAANIAAFAPLNTTAAWLLVPYLAWVTFAAALNLAIWRLNRDRIGTVPGEQVRVVRNETPLQPAAGGDLDPREAADVPREGR